MSSSKSKNSVLMQAGILAAAGIVCRIIGMLYNSPLTAIIGDEGNGYYSAAYNIYTIILLISSYSIPSAISKVIAQRIAVKEYRNAQKVFVCALIYVIAVGGVACLFVLFGAGFLVEGESAAVLRVFAPTIFFYGLLGVLRGYFQAHGSMTQTSVSQILEQILNAAVSIGAAYLLMQLSISTGKGNPYVYGAAGSALGTGAGVLIALLFMWGIYCLNRKMIRRRIERDRTKNEESYGEIFKMLFLIVTPFILSTFVYNLTTALDQKLFTQIMIHVKQLGSKEMLTEYGIFARKAVALSNIPIALSSAMSSALMPSISSSFAKGEIKQTRGKVAFAIKATMLISIPAAVGIGVLARPVVLALYPQRESLELASRLLTGLAVTVVFYALSTLTNAVLQGIGKVNLPVINAAVALGVQTAVLVPILRFTELGIYGLVIAATVYSLLMCVLNGISVKKHLRYRQDIDKTFLRPLFASAVMGAAAYGVYEGCSRLLALVISSEYVYSLISLVLAVIVAVPVYFVVVIKIKGLREDELMGLPKGAMLARVARKMKVLK